MIYSIPILIYLAAALIISKVPFIGTFLSICHTLLYEVVGTLLSEGKNRRIRLRTNSAITEEFNPLMYLTDYSLVINDSSHGGTTTSGIFKRNVHTYISYTAVSLASIGLFYLVSISNYHLVLYILMALTAVSILFWIRRISDILWALSFIVLLVLPIYFGYEVVVMHMAIFLASYILVQSLIKALVFCRQNFSRGKQRGMMAKIKSIPTIILGFVLVGQSLIAGYLILSNNVFHIGLPWSTFSFLPLL